MVSLRSEDHEVMHKDQSDENVSEADERRPSCGEADDYEQGANAIGQCGKEQTRHHADVQRVGKKPSMW